MILYKILPIAVPQIIFDRQEIDPSIKQNSRYPLIKRREYYNFEENELLNSKRMEKFYLCPLNDSIWQLFWSRKFFNFLSLNKNKKIKNISTKVRGSYTGDFIRKPKTPRSKDRSEKGRTIFFI